MILLEKIKNPQIKKNGHTYIKDLTLPMAGLKSIDMVLPSSIICGYFPCFVLNFILNFPCEIFLSLVQE
jgi:hypothetical protein